MQLNNIYYFKRLLIYSAIIVILSLVVSFYLPNKFVSPAIPYLLLFFILVSLTTHYLMLKKMRKNMSKFVNFFMITIFVKLLLYILVIIIYALVNPYDLIPFVVTFFIFYLFYTIFELIYTLKFQKEFME